MSIEQEAIISHFEVAMQKCQLATALELLVAVHAHDSVLNTLAKCAAKAGFIDGCKLILSKLMDAGFDHRNCVSQMTAVCQEAFLVGNQSLAHCLLRADFMEAEGDSIHLACTLGDLRKVLCIIESAMTTYKLNDYLKDVGVGSCTPVQTACICGHLNIVKIFVERLKVVDSKAFAFACASGRLDIVNYILEHQEKHLINYIGSNTPFVHIVDPFLMACEYGRLDVVKLLISKVNNGFASSYRDSSYRYLQAACEKGHKHVAYYLLSQSSLFNFFNRSANGNRVLNRVSCLLCCACMEELGIPIASYVRRDWDYDCAQLAEYDCLTSELTQFLTNQLFLDNHVGLLESTQLTADFAAYFTAGLEQHSEAICNLYKGDVLYFQPKPFRHTERDQLWALLEMGMMDRHKEVRQDYGTDFLHYSLFYACSIEKDQRLVDRLLELGARFDLSQVMLPNDDGYIMMIETIIRSGQDLELPYVVCQNTTLLLYCSRTLKVEGVRLLLAAGAKITIDNRSGWDVLDYLKDGIAKQKDTSERMKQDFIAIFHMLVIAGYDPSSALSSEDWETIAAENNVEELFALAFNL